MPIDPPQRTHAQTFPKLVQDGSGRDAPAVGQTCEVSPGPLLGQQFDQQVQGMGRGQQDQEQQTKELGGRPARAAAPTAMRWQQLVDEIVGHEVRELQEQGGGAGRGQGSIHGPQATPLEPTKSVAKVPHDFSRRPHVISETSS